MPLTRYQSNIIKSNQPLYPRTELITRIKILLHQTENAYGTEKKKVIATKIFQLLYKNRWFLREHKKFSDVVFRKLDEFQVNGWDHARVFRIALEQEQA